MKTEIKKQYSKPQLAQVRLVYQNPVLMSCNSVNDVVSKETTCNDLNTYCSATN